MNSRNAPSLDLPARFMVFSILALAISAGSAPWTLPLLAGNIGEFSLLAFVHLNTLGFIGAMIIGASYQLVPVALQVPLSSIRWGRVSFWFYGSGVLLFLGGLMSEWLPGLAIGASLLGIAFALYAVIIVTTWRHAPHHDVVAWHILLGAVGAIGGMSLGVMLAINKSSGMLGDRLLDLLAAHIIVMLGGWVAITFIGVAYRLIGMFTLSEQHFRTRLAWTTLPLTASGTWVLALRFALPLPSWTGQVAALLLLCGFAGFAVQIGHLYRRRMRRTFDVHVPFALVAASLMITVAAMLTFGLMRHLPANDPLWVATTWLALFGVAGTAIQGFFYKIATFLVWLKRYAPVAGTQPVPRLEDLYNRRLAIAGWALWTTAMIAGALTMVFRIEVLAAVGVEVGLAIICFLVNVIAIARHWQSGRSPSLTRKRLVRQQAAAHIP
ncbi:MAG: hypothetical protein ACR2OU_03245 [Thermomicrobiales bacterium]